MKKYVLYIAADGICDMDEFKDGDILHKNNTVVIGYDKAVEIRNHINIVNGFGVDINIVNGFGVVGNFEGV